MKKTIIIGMLAALGLGSSGVIAAPGPNGSNNYGLCKAYSSGSENGRANKRKAPPFVALEAVSEEAYDAEHGEDNEASIQDKVAWWCEQNAPHPSSNGGGNAKASEKGAGKRR
jgi:hypothetical protein